MLKLKIQLDPKSAKQMLALSSFAAVLADVSDNAKNATLAVEGLAAVKLVNEAEPEACYYYGKPKVEAPKVEAPKVEEEAPKRKRRTKAEIEAEKAENYATMKAELKAGQEEAESDDEDDADADAEEVEDEGTDAEEAESDDADAEEVDETESASGVTLDDIRRAVAEKKAVHLQVMKFKLKEGFNASKLDDLKPAQFAAFYKFVSAL
jgi:Mg-chelatase subunit ChlI